MTTDQSSGSRSPTRLTAKLAAAALLALLAETLFDVDSAGGGVIGAMALAWLAALLVTRPVVVRRTAGRIAIGIALAYALILVDDPSLLALVLFWIALSLATLLPRHDFNHALCWVPRLGWHALGAIVSPWQDRIRAIAAQRRRSDRPGGVRAIAAVAIVPVLGGALFLILFATANPLIGEAFGRISLPDGTTVVWRTLLGLWVLAGSWASLRPRVPAAGEPALHRAAADMRVPTLIASLATFNLIFASENALDILFLWSGAPLPAGVTMADYAHRGAYTLIATALLAGLFVLVTLRPGGVGAASPAVRRLVTLWIVQNLLLVASSALRLLDYVAAYSMTVLRLSALLWMALVAIGLALILWRLLGGRSAAWLINANAASGALVLSAATAVDLAATAAAWNTTVAARPGASATDLCYLQYVGSSALVPLARLERRTPDPERHDAIASLRWEAQVSLARRQADWRSWTFRGARRLAQAERLVGTGRPPLRPAPNGRACGEVLPPPPPVAEATPLTKAPQR